MFTFLESIESAENTVSRELVKLCVTVIEQYTDALLNRREMPEWVFLEFGDENEHPLVSAQELEVTMHVSEMLH
jgi:hypothetical protein